MLLTIYDDVSRARETVLRRRRPEDVVLSGPVRERIRQVFGTELNPEQVVREILQDVRANGDEAVRRFGLAFDGLRDDMLEVSPDVVDKAWHETKQGLRDALQHAAARIRRFHERA